jgi:hypothetical protein
MDAQLLEVSGHAAPHLDEFAFEAVDLLLQSGHVDLLFRLEGIHIARDVEVVLVLLNLRRCGAV